MPFHSLIVPSVFLPAVWCELLPYQIQGERFSKAVYSCWLCLVSTIPRRSLNSLCLYILYAKGSNVLGINGVIFLRHLQARYKVLFVVVGIILKP